MSAALCFSPRLISMQFSSHFSFWWKTLLLCLCFIIFLNVCVTRLACLMCVWVTSQPKTGTTLVFQERKREKEKEINADFPLELVGWCFATEQSESAGDQWTFCSGWRSCELQRLASAEWIQRQKQTAFFSVLYTQLTIWEVARNVNYSTSLRKLASWRGPGCDWFRL